MTRTLSQVVGTMPAIREKDKESLAEAKRKIQNQDLTTGLRQTHAPLDMISEEDARRLLVGVKPDQYKPVAVTVAKALAVAKAYAVPALDVMATSDKTNQAASADVVLPDGTVLLNDVPVSHLVWLGNTYLPEWRKVIAALPVLDPTKNWTPGDEDVYHSDPEVRVSTAKKIIPLELHPGNAQHKPQVQPIEDTVTVGHYTTVAMSGAVLPSRKRELLDRWDMVISAVRDATARANHTPVTEVSEGERLLGFLLA